MDQVVAKNQIETQSTQKFDKLTRLAGIASYALYVLSGVFSLLLGFIMFANVITRYFFNQPIEGAAELSVYLIYITAFIAAPWLLKVDKHITVDLLSESAFLKNRYVSIIKELVCFAVVLLIMFRSIAVTYDQFVQGVIILDTFELPKYIMSSIIPVCFFLLSILYIERIWNKLKA